MPRKQKEDVMIEPGQGLNLDPELIKQLVPGMLDRSTLEVQLRALKKAIFERALGAEMTHHLGYGKGEAKPADLVNYRNGSSRKRGVRHRQKRRHCVGERRFEHIDPLYHRRTGGARRKCCRIPISSARPGSICWSICISTRSRRTYQRSRERSIWLGSELARVGILAPPRPMA